MKYWIIGIITVLCIVAIRLHDAKGSDDRYLVLCVDVSGSVDDYDYRIQKQSYYNVLTDPDIQRSLRGTKIAIVEFSVAVYPVHQFSNQYNLIAERYKNRPRRDTGRGTTPESCINYAISMLKDKTGTRVIDISGDGPNSRWINNIRSGIADHTSDHLKVAADNLGIVINGVIFDLSDNRAYDYYKASFINGFLLVAETINEFEEKLRIKLMVEIS